MALVDADYCFISIDVGAYGASSDCNIFKNTNFCTKLEGNHLNIPDSRSLPNDDNGTPMPFVIVGDEAFALSEHVLRPYPTRNLDIQKRIYNNRLTRARRMVEYAFGVLCNKWRIFHGAIDVRPDLCDVIVKTCCILHNFVRQKEGFQFQDTLFECPLDSVEAVGTRDNVTGTAVREYFCKNILRPHKVLFLGNMKSFELLCIINTEVIFGAQSLHKCQHSTWIVL
ncbi:hypothetical protein Cfor_09816 [Coptotermes formosanus]|jgi:hypothetical protein|uniref:DDE Tnp4 domain-containing protein n=1 Tax=Coptotermes formosanus TaxID=36987 RepID=A0A6L2QB28_COPFO|nr:hypothetical protein Cfor_09816 [Coptotermes formosanus]